MTAVEDFGLRKAGERMFQVQMHVMNAMLDWTAQYAEACQSFLDPTTHNDREQSADADRASASHAMAAVAGTREKDQDGKVISLPRIPESGGSWYRKPYEHPVLVFWEEMFRPWRTHIPGYSGFGGSAGPAASMGGLPGIWATALMPWLRLPGQAGGPGAANPFAHMLPTFPLHADAWAWTQAMNRMAAPSAAADGADTAPPVSFATAKIVFPDDTEVTITLPYFVPVFAAGQNRS